MREEFGIDISISVNLSPSQLRQPRLVDRVAEILAETGCIPGRIEIEITESAVIDDLKASAVIVADLRKLGLKVALDDFGTGYSSLSIVKAFSVDSLKIDGSFVYDICTNLTGAAIVGATIGLARQLGIRTVAECIETAAQNDMLRKLDCKAVQGFLYSPPLPESSLVPWLKAYDPGFACPDGPVPARPILISRTDRGSRLDA
jgi:EAL domain-containing protein (putative c-di-GMP-specific phosphodiesterase class I)